jgi:hypothetical protein
MIFLECLLEKIIDLKTFRKISVYFNMHLVIAIAWICKINSKFQNSSYSGFSLRSLNSNQ